MSQDPITEAFEAGWKAHIDSGVPDDDQRAFRVMLHRFQDDPIRRSFHKIDNGKARIVVGVLPGTYCFERKERKAAAGQEIAGIYIDVKPGFPLWLYIPPGSDTAYEKEGCFCSPSGLRKMALEMLQFADALDYERRIREENRKR